MTIEEQALLSNYKELTALDSEQRVWLVRDESTSEIYVKKTVPCDSPTIYQRLQEARIDGIPEIHLVIENGDEVVIVEEYIHGATAEKHFRGTPATDENIAEMGVAICEILDKLHQLNPPIICRDIKPSNIMVSHGKYYLTDFNIARYYQQEMNEDTRLLGTAPYAAPEQYGFGQTDAKSDLYSLGVTMNVLRTGALPKAHLAAGKLGSVIKRATHIDPEHRFHDAGAMKRALASFIKTPTANPTQVTGLSRLKKPGTVIAWILYITWLMFLIQYDEPVLVDGQKGTLVQNIATKAIFFLVLFIPYFYNANYFGILDKTIGHFRNDKRKFLIHRILFTLLYTIGIPILLVILFI